MTTIYFIDAGVSNYQSIANELGASATIVVLQPDKNGLEQIATQLSGVSNLDAIHIFSHGSAGELFLGNSAVSTDTLNQNAALLAKIGQSLSNTGDILLYGCDVAQGETGQHFVNILANLTGADVAASDDLTGSAALGGDWDLEVKAGEMETYPLMMTNYYDGVLAAPTITLNSVSDSGIIGDNTTLDKTPIFNVTLSNIHASYVVSWSGGAASQTYNNSSTGIVNPTPASNLSEGIQTITVNSYSGSNGNGSVVDSGTYTFKVDATPPIVTSFSSTTANSSYKAGSTVNITATMNESVVVGSKINVTLDTGAVVTLTAASAGTTLTGTYTVVAGNNSSDLTVSSYTNVTTSVKDTAGNTMTTTILPTGSNNIAGASAIVIDTTAPTVTSFSSTTADGSYKAGSTVNITATMSESVATGSKINATLDTGVIVTLTAASAGTTLTGTYTVAAGDDSSDLTVSGYTNGATSVKDTAGNTMSAFVIPTGTNNIAGAKAIVIDTTAPAVTSFSSTTADGSYKAGSTVNITATMSESIATGSKINATLDTGAVVTLTAASAGTTLTGTYTVAAGNNSNDLTVSSYTNGAISVKDTVGNTMSAFVVPTGSNNIAGASAIVIDTTAPTAPTISLANDNGSSSSDKITNDGTLNIGAETGATVEYSTNGTSGWIASTPTPSQGSNNVYARQIDTAGNASSASAKFIFTYDNVAPINTTAATAGTGNEDTTITVTLSATDTGGTGSVIYAVPTLPITGTLYTDSATTTKVTVGASYSSGTFYFKPNLDYNGTTSFDFTATDLAGNTTPATTKINITAVNDAPVFSSAAISTITQVAGAPAPVSNSIIGTLVSSLVSSSNVTDVDGTGLGIAITAVDSTQGNWSYTTDNATTWTSVGSVSTSNALFLAADTNTRLYFDPSSTGIFSIATGATFKAWDQTDSYLNGSKHSIYSSGTTLIGSVSTNNASAPVSVVAADLLDTSAPDDFSSVIRAGTESTKNYKVRGNYATSDYTDFDDSDTSKPAHHRYDQESGASQSATKYVDRYAASATDANHILKNTDATTFNHNEYKIGSYGTLYLKDGDITNKASYVYVPDDAAVNALNAGTYTETFKVNHYTGYSSKTFSGYKNTDTITFTIVGVNDAPLFTSLTSPVASGNEDNQISVSFSDLTAQGNESDVEVGGSVAAFTVKAVTTGTLKIGTNANSATDFSSTNNTIDSTHFAYWTPAVNANGTLNAFTVVAKDNNGLESSTAAVQAQITVAAVNDVPSFTKGSDQTIDEDAGVQTASGWATSLSKGGGTDEATQALNFIVSNDNAALFSAAPTIDSTGKLTYTPALNANGTATVSVQIHDNGGVANTGVDTSATQTFTINVNAINDAPTLTSFSDAVASGDEDTEIPVTIGGLSGKGDENDVDGLNTITAFTIKELTSGTLKIGANAGSAIAFSGTNNTIDANRIAYWTPDANANGTLNAFTVVAKDNGGLESSTPVQAQIAVTPVNDLPKFTDSSSISLTDTAAPDSFSNQTGKLTATDVDTGATQTYGAASSSSVNFTSGGKTYDLAKTGNYGVLYIKSTTGDYVYVPDSSTINAINVGLNPVDAFTVTVSDGIGASVEKSLNVNITGANDTPIIVDPFDTINIADTANQAENFTSILGDVHATDAENTTLTYSIESAPSSANSYGSLTINSLTGHYTFDPDETKINGLLAGDHLSSTYTLKVSDPQGEFATQNLTVNITGANDDPTITVNATALTVTDSAAFDNFSALTGSLKGSAPDAGVTYSVTGGTVDANDADLISKTNDYGTLTVSKSNGTFSFLPDAAKVNSLKASDTDVITEFVVQTISNAVGNTPSTNQKTLTYHFDGANDDPRLTDAKASLGDGTEDTTYNILASDLLKGYTDVDSTTLSVADLSATKGTLKPNGVNFIFTPNPNENGTVELTYTVNDNDGGSFINAKQSFTLVAVNDAPTAGDSSITINEDHTYTFSTNSAVTDFGYSDIENDAMVGIKITSVPDASKGVLKLGTTTLANDAVITKAQISNLSFVPNLDFYGTAKFDFKVSDNGGYSQESKTITFTVNPVNDAPTAADKKITLDEDSTYTFSEGDFGYYDVENSPISSIKIINLPSAGVLAFDNSTNEIQAGDVINSNNIAHLTFTPAPNANGAAYADFDFTVNDGDITNSNSSPANTISLAVTPVNDAPTFTALSSAVTTGDANSAIPVTFANLKAQGNEADIDGTVDAFVVKAVSSGTLKIGSSDWNATSNNIIDATRTASWTPATDVKGDNINAFTVVAKDNDDLESALPAVQAKVNVSAVNSLGVVGISGTPIQGGTLTAQITDDNGLPSSPAPSLQWRSNGNNISGATGSTYTLKQSDVGKAISVKATYTDNDGFDENDTGTITGTVANVNDLGKITISGTPIQGQVLTANLVDDDGLVNVTPSYQWKSSASSAVLATTSTYTLKDTDVGKTINVQATYTDNGGFSEHPISSATSTVTDSHVTEGTNNGNNNAQHIYYATSGNDIITGTSRSDDTVDYSSATSAVTVSLENTKQQDTKGSGFDTITKIENLTGSNYDDTLTGGVKNNVKNVIDGGLGADTMTGGIGDDTYYVDNADDKVIEVTKQGVDTIISTIDYSLVGLPYVENLTLSGTASTATGNDYTNYLKGNSGNNTLDGGAGADTMDGGAGNDTYIVDNTKDTIRETAGNGTDSVLSSVSYTLNVIASIENLTLTGSGNINGTGNFSDNLITGNSGNNVLDGSLGNDTLNGGLGNDTLKGGSGNDHFQLTASGVDTITDFAKGDKIDLSSSVFVNTVFGTNILYVKTTGILSYDADGAGSIQPVQIALIGTTTHPALSATDFGIIA